jgi:predicted ester cyclase
MIMKTEKNKEIVRRYIEEGVNTGNVDNLAEFISPEYIESLDPSAKTLGLECARQHILAVRRTFPDLRLTIERQIAEGDWVVTCLTARATHLGTWLDIKPTCKRVEITCVNVDKVIDGLIVEHGGAANMFEALLGIGAIRAVTD